MDGRKWVFPCELALLTGVTIVAIAVCLFVRSGYGVTVIASIPLMISYTSPVLDFGTWNIIYQALLLCIAMAITRRANMGYGISLLEGVLFGTLLNVVRGMLPDTPLDVELSIVYLVIAHILLFLGVSFFVRSYILLLQCDMFIRDVVNTYGIGYRVFKTAFDIFCMLVSVVIGILCLGDIVDIGIGTLISASLTGFFVSRITVRIYDRFFEFRPMTKLCARYLSDDAPCKNDYT